MKVITSVLMTLSLSILVISCRDVEEELYYLPQLEIYIRTLDNPQKDYYYLFFSKDSSRVLSDSADCIEVTKHVSTVLVLDKEKKNNIYACYNGNISKIKAREFVIHKSLSYAEDTIYYKPRHKTTRLQLKEPFIELVFGKYLSHPSLVMEGEEDNIILQMETFKINI